MHISIKNTKFFHSFDVLKLKNYYQNSKFAIIILHILCLYLFYCLDLGSFNNSGNYYLLPCLDSFGFSHLATGDDYLYCEILPWNHYQFDNSSNDFFGKGSNNLCFRTDRTNNYCCLVERRVTVGFCRKLTNQKD